MHLVASLLFLTTFVLAAVATPTPPDALRATTVSSSESGAPSSSSAINYGTDLFTPVDLVPANVELGIQEEAKPKSHGPGGCMIACDENRDSDLETRRCHAYATHSMFVQSQQNDDTHRAESEFQPQEVAIFCPNTPPTRHPASGTNLPLLRVQRDWTARGVGATTAKGGVEAAAALPRATCAGVTEDAVCVSGQALAFVCFSGFRESEA
ncbi:hypothetical protein FB451DRAFT_1186300 [Mycena latifolia]|nr:hypothetical protein FB451DRAFT_1186300 [Mycena latifolia]